MRSRIAIPLAVGLTALACQLDRKLPDRLAKWTPAAAAPRDVNEPKSAAMRAMASGLTGSAAAVDGAASPAELAQDPAWSRDPAATETPAMIIRTGTASLRIDSLEPALVRLHALAGRVGGYVANTAVQAGPAQYRQATLEVRVPAAHFDDLITGLDPLGKVEAVNVTAEDVGEEFVDVSARVTNAKRLESRLIDLLATRTGRLQDVLSVERELARVREEIERYEGRLRYLRTRAATSSLSITVHEPVPVVGDPGSNVLVRAFERAWRNFVELLAGFIASLGVLVPLVVAGGTAIWGVRRWRRPAVQ
jgi:Domain of unknown function (DUF4349)